MFRNLLLLYIFVDICVTQSNSILITTNSGPVRGKRYEFKSKFNQKAINSFIGIPYAMAPVGNNRFKPPQPMKWNTEKDVTNNRVMCIQVNQRFSFNLTEPIREDEDCLFLNIFTPVQPFSTKPVNGFPVMFYIHGGQFQFSGKDFYPPEYLLDNDIILVTINYRLGVLGFFSTGDDSCPGNLGIHDQIAALKWISLNIKYFDGNPQNITVFGHDSGAISASILLIASNSWGLFQNVMIISGSIFSPYAIKPINLKTILEFSQILNCDLNSQLVQNPNNVTQKVVECLRTKTAQELMDASRLPGLLPNTYQFSFGPVIDKNVSSPLIIDHPIRLFRSGNYWKVPLVVGLTLNEGSLDYFVHYDKIREWSLSDKLQYLFGHYDYNELYSKLLIKSVDWFYFKRFNESNTVSNIYDSRNNYPFVKNNNLLSQTLNRDLINKFKEEQTLIEALGDFTYGSANTYLLDLHSVNSKFTYFYVLEHKGLKTFGTIQRNGSQIIHRDQYGVTHMDDIFYLFPTLYSDNKTSSYDEPVIRTVCQYFTYFAKYGRFDTNNAFTGYQIYANQWMPYSIQNPYYMRFYYQNSQMFRGFRTEFLSFWNYFVREMFEEIYGINSSNNSMSQISAQFIGTVQLKGIIRFGDNKFVIS